MVKVILDTNIWISAIFYRGRLFAILDAWEEKQYTLYFSPETFAELQEKLLYWGSILGHKEIAARYVALVKQQAKFVYPQQHFDLCEDKDDNKFLDAAVASEAQYIVSGDKKLQKVGQVENIPVITPSAFLAILHE